MVAGSYVGRSPLAERWLSVIVLGIYRADLPWRQSLHPTDIVISHPTRISAIRRRPSLRHEGGCANPGEFREQHVSLFDVEPLERRDPRRWHDANDLNATCPGPISLEGRA